MQNREAWSHLSDDEKTIIAVKLTLNKKEESSQTVFNDRFTGKNEQETAALVTAIQNLIDNAGGRSNSEVWRQIQSIDGGWVDEKNSSSAALSLTVSSSKDFLAVLRNNGYDVDRYYEFVTGHKHSARFITEYSYHPGMHFVQEHGYPDNRFDVHWDPRSSAFRKVSRWYYWLCALAPKIAERVVAGKTHNNPISAIQVRRELMKMGIVENEQT
jgi:hypothetical protein